MNESITALGPEQGFVPARSWRTTGHWGGCSVNRTDHTVRSGNESLDVKHLASGIQHEAGGLLGLVGLVGSAVIIIRP